MRVEVDLDYDAIDSLIRSGLVESYDLQLQAVTRYQGRSDLGSLEEIDYKDSRKIMKALRKVIRYFSTPEQWCDFTDKYGE